MWHRRFDPKEVPAYEKNKQYTNRELELMSELILREDARREMCRECNEFGEASGKAKIVEQFDKEGAPIIGETGDQLALKFPEYICPNNHKWYKGEGKAKGTKGKFPILFEEHLIQRKRREINSDSGTVDPSIVSGLYWRSHSGGRTINSKEDRATKGVGWYR